MAKTSIHLKPCKWRSSEAHNRREKELDYVRKDLSRLNRSWVGTDDLPKLYSSIRALVKEKTGRAMQEKAEPLYEGVVVIDERTGIDDLLEIGRRFGREFGYKLLQAYIHADEGHYERAGDPSSWKSNLHAHLVFDRYDHETGKGIRTTRADTERMQDIWAEVLGMERGLPSDKKHLDAGRYKAAALAAREEALEARIGELEEERKEKAREADRENGRAILRGVANVFGKGKYTEIEKENARLRDELDEEAAEKEKLAAANKKLKAEKEKLKADIPSAEEKGRRQGKQEGKVAVDSLRRELEDAYKQFKEAYEKAYRLPEGVEEDAVRIGKYADGRWKVSADLGDAGRTSRRDLSPADCAAYFRERVITKAQLAAKYLGTEMKSLLEGFRNRAALVAGKRQAARVRQPDGRRP